MDCNSLYLAMLLLGVAWPAGEPSGSPAPGAANSWSPVAATPATPTLSPVPAVAPGNRRVIASSTPQGSAVTPVVPLPDDGLPAGRPPAPPSPPPRLPQPPADAPVLQRVSARLPDETPTPTTVTPPEQPTAPPPAASPPTPAPMAAPAPMPTPTPTPAPVAPPETPRPTWTRKTAPVTPGGSADGLTRASQTATLFLETIGPPEDSLGKPLTYQIVVRNPGTTPVCQVRVQDELSAGAHCLKTEPPAEVHGQQLLWDLGTLDGGAERSLRVEVEPGATGDVLGTATASCSTTSSLRTRIIRPHLTVTNVGPESALVGDTIPFQILVSNNGTGPALNVIVHDHLPDGLQHVHGEDVEASIGNLEPGDTKTVPLQVRAIKGGRQVNQAMVTADGGLEAKAEVAVVVGEASLVLRPSGPREAPLHRELESRLEVVNTGQVPATDVHLIDTLPDGLDLVAAANGGVYTAATRSVEWSLGTLAPGQTRTVSVQLLARAPGDWTNQTVARAERGLEARADTNVHVEGVPGLLLEAVDLDDPVEVGGQTAYEIHVVNQGTGACSNVQVLAIVPEGMVPVGAEGPSGHRIVGQRVMFEPLQRLAGRADTRYRIRVRAKEPGDWRFQVYLKCDQFRQPVYEQESTVVYADEGRGSKRVAGEPQPSVSRSGVVQAAGREAPAGSGIIQAAFWAAGQGRQGAVGKEQP